MHVKKACYNLTAIAIYDCLTPISTTKSENQKRKIIKRRIDFAKGKLIKVFCDCSPYFECNTIRNKIINYNENL